MGEVAGLRSRYTDKGSTSTPVQFIEPVLQPYWSHDQQDRQVELWPDGDWEVQVDLYLSRSFLGLRSLTSFSHLPTAVPEPCTKFSCLTLDAQIENSPCSLYQIIMCSPSSSPCPGPGIGHFSTLFFHSFKGGALETKRT